MIELTLIVNFLNFNKDFQHIQIKFREINIIMTLKTKLGSTLLEKPVVVVTFGASVVENTSTWITLDLLPDFAFWSSDVSGEGAWNVTSSTSVNFVSVLHSSDWHL